MAGDEALHVTTSDGVVDVVVDVGDDRNLLSMAMCRQLLSLLLDPPEGAHVLRLRAVGPAFCLGRERGADDPAALRAEATTLADLNAALRSSRLVTVAEVGGDAAGFGVGLFANADVAVASRDATFWFPEVRIDLVPAVVLAWLPEVVGRKQAFWLTASGSPIDAERALELGLLTAVAPAEELGAVVDDVVATLRQHAPRVHAGIKDFLGTTADLGAAGTSALAVERLIVGSMSRRRDGEHGPG